MASPLSTPALLLPDEEPSSEARERLIQSAFRLFGRQGYARTSVQEIAEAAGVKKPVLYYYFQSKEGLYRALVDQSSQLFHGFLTAALQAAGEPGGPVEDRLARMAETILQLARENKDPARFFFTHFLAADADRPICDDAAFERTPPKLLQSLAEEGIARGELRGDPADLERLVAGAIQLSIIKHLRHPQEEPLAPGLGKRIVRAALAGFLAR